MMPVNDKRGRGAATPGPMAQGDLTSMDKQNATAFVRILDRADGPVAYAAVTYWDGATRTGQKTKRIGRVHAQKVGAQWKPIRSRPAAGVLTIDEARARLADYVTVPAVATATSPVVTVAQAAGAWLADCERQDCSPSTIRDYRSVVSAHVKSAPFADRPVTEVTVDAIRKFRAGLEGHGLRPRTVDKVLTYLGGVFALAGVDPNPVTEAKPNERRTKARAAKRAAATGAPDYFTWAELERVVAAATSEQDQRMVILTARTGLRLGEVLELRWGDVEVGWVHVRRSYDKSGEVGPPKNGKPRRVPLDPSAAAALGPRGLDDGLVFPNAHGRQQHPDAVGHRFLRLQRRAKVYQQDRGWHCLRHSFGTFASEIYPLPNVQQWMGHRDIQTTMRYVHAVPQVDAPQRLGERWPTIEVVEREATVAELAVAS
jgi:integrase